MSVSAKRFLLVISIVTVFMITGTSVFANQMVCRGTLMMADRSSYTEMGQLLSTLTNISDTDVVTIDRIRVFDGEGDLYCDYPAEDRNQHGTPLFRQCRLTIQTRILCHGRCGKSLSKAHVKL